jgi:hypothetical protein
MLFAHGDRSGLRASLLLTLVWAQSSHAKPPLAADHSAIWKTINIGTYRSVIDLREALEAAQCAPAQPTTYAGHSIPRPIPCKLGDSANEIIGRPQFELSKAPEQIELVRVSGKDLGYPPESQPSLGEIYERAASLGYALCPPEAGAQLRLQYTNQKVGEFLVVAMRPIRDYEGDLTIFSVGNGGAGLLLVGNNGDPDVRVSPSVSFVFMRSPQPPMNALAKRTPVTTDPRDAPRADAGARQ